MIAPVAHGIEHKIKSSRILVFDDPGRTHRELEGLRSAFPDLVDVTTDVASVDTLLYHGGYAVSVIDPSLIRIERSELRDFVKSLSQDCKGAVIVAESTLNAEDLKLKAGVDYALAIKKPYNSDQLVNQIRALIEKS